MIKFKKIAATLAIAGALAIGATACEPDEGSKRTEAAQQSAAKSSLEKQNLDRKLKLEENPNQTGYVYLVTFGKPFGYYAIKGKVSNSGSQIDPEDLIVCRFAGDSCQTVDGPQDDGTYGTGDPGIFFFTADGTMVSTSLDYVYSTQPLPSALDVPKLG